MVHTHHPLQWTPPLYHLTPGIQTIGLWMRLPSLLYSPTWKRFSHLVVCCSSGQRLHILLLFLSPAYQPQTASMKTDYGMLLYFGTPRFQSEKWAIHYWSITISSTRANGGNDNGAWNGISYRSEHLKTSKFYPLACTPSQVQSSVKFTKERGHRPSCIGEANYGIPEEIFFNTSNEGGKDNEEKARKMYIWEREAVGENMSVRETGLTLCPTMSYIGASADGYVTCHSVDTCCCGALEIECPFSIGNESVVHLTPHQIAERFGNKFCLVKGENGMLHLNEWIHGLT